MKYAPSYYDYHHRYLNNGKITLLNQSQKLSVLAPTGAFIFFGLTKKTNQKKSAPITSPHKKHAGTLVSRNINGCCVTRES